MFTFTEFATSEVASGHQWFTLKEELVDKLTSEEKSQVFIEEVGFGYCRLWYPRSNYRKTASNLLRLKVELRHALVDGKLGKAMEIRERMKSL
jgi:hypothetical protein